MLLPLFRPCRCLRFYNIFWLYSPLLCFLFVGHDDKPFIWRSLCPVTASTHINIYSMRISAPLLNKLFSEPFTPFSFGFLSVHEHLLAERGFLLRERWRLFLRDQNEIWLVWKSFPKRKDQLNWNGIARFCFQLPNLFNRMTNSSCLSPLLH